MRNKKKYIYIYINIVCAPYFVAKEITLKFRINRDYLVALRGLNARDECDDADIQ